MTRRRSFPSFPPARRGLLGFFLLAALPGLWRGNIAAAGTGYLITELSITNAEHPSINNAGEIVWATQNGVGIYSSVHGQLSATGVSPHIANSGEVVYADMFQGPNLDLVSSTRGQLTTNGDIQLGYSDFDVNASGEVVYAAPDLNTNWQIYSTVRGQITFDPLYHYNPCINDSGEILWNQSGAAPNLISSTRGPLPGYYPLIYAVNNFDEFCYEAVEQSGPLQTSPHIASNLHGVVIDDADQEQWGGGINDAGTLVWAAPANPATYIWAIFEGTWVGIPPLAIVPGTSSLTLEWPTNSAAFQVQYTTNLAPAIWQRLGGNPATSGGNFQLTVTQDFGGAVFFRLSTGAP